MFSKPLSSQCQHLLRPSSNYSLELIDVFVFPVFLLIPHLECGDGPLLGPSVSGPTDLQLALNLVAKITLPKGNP